LIIDQYFTKLSTWV